ncbi:MAG TPA: hypothetical protein VFI89_05350, partial [Burkholderiales bacterium]|nr:hypothetical protein [Burkholderiales bacterium]
MLAPQRAAYAALVTVPLAVERLLTFARSEKHDQSAERAAAIAELERLNVEAYTLREYLREPSLSPAAQDQAEAALDAMQ